MSVTRILKGVGIRLVKWFGVFCALAGYFIAVVCVLFTGADQLGIGLGLICLGVPHILAAQHLQRHSDRAAPQSAFNGQPSVAALLARGLTLPLMIVSWVAISGLPDFLMAIGTHWLNPAPIWLVGLFLWLTPTLLWIVGVSIVLDRPPGALAEWHREFIQWGWLVLFAGCITVFLIFTSWTGRGGM